jgi:hypothetical protein
VTVLKLAEGRGGIEDGIKVYEDIHSNEQRGATARQRTMRILVFYQEILQEKSLSCHASVLDFKPSSEIHTSLPGLLSIGSYM